MAAIHRTKSLDQANIPQSENHEFRKTRSEDTLWDIEGNSISCSQIISSEQKLFNRSIKDLDQDPTRLTVFPIPGNSIPLNKFEENSSNEHIDGRSQDSGTIHKELQSGPKTQQYWMPDQVCKQCFDCGLEFSFFRRKHHCRLCGQVFCHQCSSHNVEGSIHGFNSTIRVCNFCYEMLVREKKEKEQLSRRASVESDSSILPVSPLSSPDAADSIVSSITLNDSTMNDQQTTYFAEKSQQLNSYSAPLTRDLRSGSIDASSLSNETNIPIKSHNTTRRMIRRPSIEVQESLTGIRNSTHGLLDFAESCSMLRQKLKGDAMYHLRTIVKRYMDSTSYFKSHSLYSYILDTSIDLASRASCTIVPLSSSKNSCFHIHSLVKVKGIIGSEPLDLSYFSGIMLRKNIAHKKMRRSIVKPRILLLSGGIDFERAGLRLSSLDTLLEQERNYMEILVNKILSLKPDVLFVCQTVARQAKEVLQRENVVLVVNVKLHHLERISRQTGAKILPSTDHVDHFGESAIGTCEVFDVQSFYVQLNTPYAQDGLTKLARVKNETYLVLRGCIPSSGCTISIRAPSRDQLVLLKGLLKFSVNIAYRLYLESNVLADMYLTLRVVDVSIPNLLATPHFEDDPIDSTNDSAIKVQKKAHFSRYFLCLSEGKGPMYSLCGNPELLSADFFGMEDKMLGKFLLQDCFSVKRKCPKHKCRRSVYDHLHVFCNRYGRVLVSMEQVSEREISPKRSPNSLEKDADVLESIYNMDAIIISEKDDGNRSYNRNIEILSSNRNSGRRKKVDNVLMWRWCKTCRRVVSPFQTISSATWKFSVLKFLDIFLRNDQLIGYSEDCDHDFQENHVQFFGYKDKVVRFEYTSYSLWKVNEKRDLRVMKKDSVYPIYMKLRSTQLTQLSSFIFSAFFEKIKSISELLSMIKNFEKRRHDFILLELLYLRRTIEFSTTAYDEKVLLSEFEGFERSKDKPSPTIGLGITHKRVNRLQRSLYLFCSSWNRSLARIQKKMYKIIEEQGCETTSSIVGFPRNDRSQSIEYPFTTANNAVDNSSTGRVQLSATPEEKSKVVKPISGSHMTEHVDTHSVAEDECKFERTMFADNKAGRTESIGSQSHMESTRSLYIYQKPNEDMDFTVNLPSDLISGHPCLNPGSNGSVIFVFEDEPSSIIAYSLNSDYYLEEIESCIHSILTDKERATIDESSSERSNTSREQANIDKKDYSNGEKISYSSSDSIQGMILLLSSKKSHIKHKFFDRMESSPQDYNNQSSVPALSQEKACQFQVISYFSSQFRALRGLCCGDDEAYIGSLSFSSRWATSGGRSGATFSKSLDGKFVVKHITRTELQSFLEISREYFTYMSRVHFEGVPSALARVLGLYQVSSWNQVTNQKSLHHIAVMENVFHDHKISCTYDLKGSSRSRYAESASVGSESVFLDSNFMDYTNGNPLPLEEKSYKRLMASVENDLNFLEHINVIDYSMLIGFDDENGELVVGLIDYLRQYDFMKRMESVGKSVGMIAGQAEPTIIQPAYYSKRFYDAMQRYFMPVVSK